jgi:hypothetical protein
MIRSVEGKLKEERPKISIGTKKPMKIFIGF